MDVMIVVFGKVVREVFQNTRQGQELLTDRLRNARDRLHKHLSSVGQLRFRWQYYRPVGNGTSIRQDFSSLQGLPRNSPSRRARHLRLTPPASRSQAPGKPRSAESRAFRDPAAFLACGGWRSRIGSASSPAASCGQEGARGIRACIDGPGGSARLVKRAEAWPWPGMRDYTGRVRAALTSHPALPSDRVLLPADERAGI